MAEQEPIDINRLGSWEISREDDSFIGRFNGIGYITSGHSTDGSFLSSKLPGSRFDDPGKTLSVENMFPPDWNKDQVQYEIIIRAKRVTE